MKKSLTLVVATLAGAAFLMAQEEAKPAAGDADKGKETFEQCGACHNTDTDEKKMGPSLKGLFKKDKLHNGKKVTDANVKAVIDKGGNGMPPYEELLSAEEKANVIAYLKTLSLSKVDGPSGGTFHWIMLSAGSAGKPPCSPHRLEA